MQHYHFHLPFGEFAVSLLGNTVRSLSLYSGEPCDTLPDDHPVKIALGRWICGDSSELTLSIDPQGTPFQKRVWDALREIPFGETRTYGEIARMIGSPKAAQAVGGACGANPILLIIPCHRVTAANGIGGFSVGIDLKEKLLAFERTRGYNSTTLR